MLVAPCQGSSWSRMMGRSHEGGLGRIAVGFSRIGLVNGKPSPYSDSSRHYLFPGGLALLTHLVCSKRVSVGASVLGCTQCGWDGVCLFGRASPRQGIAVMVPTCNMLHELLWFNWLVWVSRVALF